MARGLMATGVSEGDRVGIWSPNYAERVLVQYSAPESGAGKTDHIQHVFGSQD